MAIALNRRTILAAALASPWLKAMGQEAQLNAAPTPTAAAPVGASRLRIPMPGSQPALKAAVDYEVRLPSILDRFGIAVR
jgi:hypothetical protein